MKMLLVEIEENEDKDVRLYGVTGLNADELSSVIERLTHNLEALLDESEE